MSRVPRISEFYGIVIAMYYREHGVPHFHATYAGETVVISIHSGDVIAGRIPARASRLVLRSIPSMDLAAHLHRIVDVEVVGEHRLRLAFDDGVSGELDASSWDWGGVFEPLRDAAYFAQVELDDELGSIRWPNGADVAPETLHLWVARGRDNVSA